MVVSKSIIESVRALRPLSPSAAQLLQVMNNPNHSLREVVQIAQRDAVITAHILRVANSAAFARRSEVSTVEKALPVLGERTVVGIALGICTAHLFNAPLEGYAGEKGELWRHCLRCAIAAREISPFAAAPVAPELAFTGGILHDLGKAVISSYLANERDKIVEGYDGGQFSDYLSAEQAALGTNHAEIGGALGVHWNLPAALVQVMLHHHHPHNAGEQARALVYIVHLGDFIAMMGGSGTGTDTMSYAIDQSYSAYVKISKRELERVMIRTGDEFEQMTSATLNAQEGSV